MLDKILIVVLSFIVGYFIDWIWARLVRGFKLEKKDYKKMIFGRIRINHNIIGYIFIILGFFFYSLILIPAGIGIILGHGRRDRGLYRFIETVKK